MNNIDWCFSHVTQAKPEQSWLTGSVPNIFTKQECDEIIKYGIANLKQATTYSNTEPNGLVNLHIRESNICWIESTEKWVYQRMEEYVTMLNNNLFHYDLTGFAEKIQFTQYVAPTGKYEAHIDRMNINDVVRKLSLTVQLSEPDTYSGGELQILTNLEYPEIASKSIGSGFAFNSMLLHRVTPVTTGRRYSLVVWVTGPPFK
jgi:PKHD-type hydroxylase